jgi:hypothetical protein
MTGLQTTSIAAVAVVLGGFGGLGLERIMEGPVIGLRLGSGRLPSDSPVVVVGGSITARTVGNWNCASIPCVSGTNPDLSQLGLVGVTAQSNDEPFAWGNLAENWIVEILDRNPTATAGLKICSDMACSGTGALSSPGPVYLQPESATTSGFYPADAPNDTKTRHGKRFKDNGTGSMSCASQGVDQDLCEKIKTVRVTINSVVKTYGCPDGACKVEVGQ